MKRYLAFLFNGYDEIQSIEELYSGDFDTLDEVLIAYRDDLLNGKYNTLEVLDKETGIKSYFDAIFSEPGMKFREIRREDKPLKLENNQD
jgi:hypothetical protein